MAGKQAKILNDHQLGLVLAEIENHRYAIRDRVLVLLSYKAGLRAGEIAKLRRRMVMNSAGEVGDMIHIEDNIAKKKSGRILPMHPELRLAIIDYFRITSICSPEDPLIVSERCLGEDAVDITEKTCMKPKSIGYFFYKLYRKIDLVGCSSHSGRRTFGTKSARKIHDAGGSLKDVQQLMGHRNLTTTQKYIEGDEDAKRDLMKLI